MDGCSIIFLISSASGQRGQYGKRKGNRPQGLAGGRHGSLGPGPRAIRAPPPHRVGWSGEAI